MTYQYEKLTIIIEHGFLTTTIPSAHLSAVNSSLQQAIKDSGSMAILDEHGNSVLVIPNAKYVRGWYYTPVVKSAVEKMAESVDKLAQSSQSGEDWKR